RHLASGVDAGHLFVPARGLGTAARHFRRPGAGVSSANRPPGPRSHPMTAERTTRAARSHVAGWLALALLLSGCGGAPPSPAPAAAKPVPGADATAAAKPGPVALPKEPEAGPALPPLSYDDKG